MAKKNSSKTATEKAISSSEPRTMTFKGWQGVNYVDAPLTWEPLDPGYKQFNQTDLPANFFMVQNNLNTTEMLGVETRNDSEIIGDFGNNTKITWYQKDEAEIEGETVYVWAAHTHTYDTDAPYSFTGVSAMYKHYVFAVARHTNSEDPEDWYESILFRDIITYPDTPSTYNDWNEIRIITGNPDNIIRKNIEICEIGFFEGNLVATAKKYVYTGSGTSRKMVYDQGMLLLAKIHVSSIQNEEFLYFSGMDWSAGTETATNNIVDTPRIDDPSVIPEITVHGMQYWEPDPLNPTPPETAPIRIQVKFCYTNRLGSTLTGGSATMYVELSPALWSTKNYVTITPADAETGDVTSVTGVDLYGQDTENLDWVFIGHVDITPEQATNHTWKYDWYGNMTDITQWLTAQLLVPTENTTRGPDASHFTCHDSRMYYWDVLDKPYRLYIGGNPGAEFSIARGLGGAWVDIEPGSGYDIKGTAKWKTTGGANIVTILCGNENTTKVKRFNLVETNLTLTNEISYKSYMYEEVSNVVGCNSRWGYGVYDDGLYCLSRYGLMLTTMAMEYNNQMKNQKISTAIEPIFTDTLGNRLADARMICINNVIYIAFSDENEDYLDNVILCYDVGLKAWYTWTHDQVIGEGDHVIQIFPVDSDKYEEGIGVITKDQIRLYPVSGYVQSPTAPLFQVLLETGELAPRLPMQGYWYVQQLELRFDYFIKHELFPTTVLIEGVDYYGRYFAIEKELGRKSRNWQSYNDNGESGELRNYIEWIRIDKIVQSIRIRIKGHARFRMTHMNLKIYQQADTIGTPYGFDAYDHGENSRGKEFKIHHYIDDYNNLRRAVIS